MAFVIRLEAFCIVIMGFNELRKSDFELWSKYLYIKSHVGPYVNA